MIAVGIANAIGFKSMSGGAKKVFSDDVARQLLGKDWRMPTRAELQELVNACDWTWKTINGVAGYEVKSRTNGNSIFLSSGTSENRFFGNMLTSAGSTNAVYCRFLYSRYYQDSFQRYASTSIRPISATKGVDLGLSVRWADRFIGSNDEYDTGLKFKWGDCTPYIGNDSNINNYVFYIDGAYRKYNAVDKLTTLELINTDPIIQKVPLWHFIKKHYDESSKTLDTTDFDLEQEEIDAIIDKLWQVTETRSLKVSFATYKLISDEQKAVVESRGWTLVRQDVYQLLDANAENNSVPKVGNSYTSVGVELTRAEGNIITLKGTATGNADTVARSVFTVNAGHRYLAGGYNDKATGMGYSGREYFGIKPKIIFTCPASYIDTYVSVVIEQGVTYDDVIRPFVIDITATFANKGQDFIDGLDTADKVAQALGYGSYAEMPYFDFNPAPDVQLALANAVMALDFYDAEPEPECLDDLNF